MEIRLNKLLSDSGLCSRREADKFIEMGRVTVNGKIPEKGQKVDKSDIVKLDDVQVSLSKTGGQTQEHSRTIVGKRQALVFGEAEANKKTGTKKEEGPKPEAAPKPGNRNKPLREGKYVKYNKYAAARKAAKSGSDKPKEANSPEEKIRKQALQPKFGKSLGKAAVAQRIAASPKSASLRKTSKNNPANKAKRASGRGHSKEQ